MRFQRNFTEHRHGQRHGEERLRLHDERGKPCRQAPLDRRIKQAELRAAHDHAVDDHVLPRNLGTRQKEDQRHGCEEVAQGCEKQRRHIHDADLDHHEVEAPEEDGDQGKKDVRH